MRDGGEKKKYNFECETSSVTNVMIFIRLFSGKARMVYWARLLYLPANALRALKSPIRLGLDIYEIWLIWSVSFL